MKKLILSFLVFSSYCVGQTKDKWYENELLWIKGHHYKTGTYSEDKDKIAEEITKKLAQFAKFKPKGKILDLACGEGFHTAYLSKLGYNVVGLDISPFNISLAKENVEKLSQKAEFKQQNILNFEDKNYYDAIVNFGYSFGYLETQEENMKVLKNIYKSLKKGGKFFIELYGKEMIDRVYPKTLIKKNGQETLLRLATIVDNYGRFQTYSYFIDKEKVKVCKQEVYLYSAKELTDMLKDAGFKIIGVYGNYDQGPYDHNAENLMVLAEK